MAPGNPYVNYVMGMSYVLAKQEAKAQPYLEESVSLDPNEATSLLALGTLRFDQGNYAGAVDLLSKAAKLDPSSWKAEWLLADACLRQRDFPQAREHAEDALAAGKGKADRVRLVLAEAVAAMGDRAGALATLDHFLSDHPNDPDALKFRAWLTSRLEASPTVEKAAVKSCRLARPRPRRSSLSPLSLLLRSRPRTFHQNRIGLRLTSMPKGGLWFLAPRALCRKSLRPQRRMPRGW
ncbi:MAG: tetratricopeptide repeat protein [Candidatus Acidiferrales bacterium]